MSPVITTGEDNGRRQLETDQLPPSLPLSFRGDRRRTTYLGYLLVSLSVSFPPSPPPSAFVATFNLDPLSLSLALPAVSDDKKRLQCSVPILSARHRPTHSEVRTGDCLQTMATRKSDLAVQFIYWELVHPLSLSRSDSAVLIGECVE